MALDTKLRWKDNVKKEKEEFGIKQKIIFGINSVLSTYLLLYGIFRFMVFNSGLYQTKQPKHYSKNWEQSTEEYC